MWLKNTHMYEISHNHVSHGLYRKISYYLYCLDTQQVLIIIINLNINLR